MLELSSYFAPAALTEYITAWTALGFGAMVWARFALSAGIEGISERRLAVLAALGGFVGIIAGGLFLRHRMQRAEFWAPVAFAAFLWVMFLIAYFNPWILPF
ncbi:MAG: DUF1294 domain-containing protein [Thaumarchaeota archaeon]|nr:DUF1294 domain-containing protein [Nitrososphaerota archaeon]